MASAWIQPNEDHSDRQMGIQKVATPMREPVEKLGMLIADRI